MAFYWLITTYLYYVQRQIEMSQEDETVVPLVLEGMNLLAKERPATEEKAIEWFAAFLLKNKNYKEDIRKAKEAESAAPTPAPGKK